VNKLFLLFFLFLINTTLLAQLELRPIPQFYSTSPSYSNGRTTATLAKLDTISLPFWDDFSFSSPGVDTTLWQNGIGVFINPSIGINQPTINVATFDGINSTGRPYNSESDFVAPTDSLISQAIDLSNVPIEKENSVYLSFFWQMKGWGELPDPKDSIRVDFLNRNGEWIRKWSVVGIQENLSDDFQKVYLQVSGSQFFHEGFRFKFQSYGKTTGAFDSWHIDYVYLNQDRNTNNESIFDHAVTNEPLSIFKTYTSIPYSQLFAFPDTIFSSVKITLASFENNIQPVEYNYIIRDILADQEIFRENSTINPLSAFGRSEVETEAIDRSIFNENTDSLYISTEFEFISGDKYFIKSINNNGADTTFLVDEEYNFRLNDKVKKVFKIHDVLAYDDGSAEFAAGINQSNGQIAIEFVLAAQDTITDIDIYFPLIKPVISEGEQMNLTVFKNLSGEVGSILAKQSFVIEPSDSINQFTRYNFEFPIVVSDTFYIGFQQFKDDFIGIGLDKTNNQGNKIQINTEGDWNPNVVVEGSLMIRPIFGKTNFDPNAVVGIEKKNIARFLEFYPNPAQNTINIRGVFDQIEMFSISGRSVKISVRENTIDTSELPNGIYILKGSNKGNFQIEKVIIRH